MATISTNEEILSNLKVILGSDVDQNIASYIQTIELQQDYDEFMENIIDKGKSVHITAYNAIKDILFNRAAKQSQNKKQVKKESNQSQNKKEKKKFTAINEYKEKTKIKEGRTACDCMGQEHDFMNNCLYCGRIHCFEEGPGPCLFCGRTVNVRGGEIIPLQTAKPSKNIKHRENKVFDDDNDYFKVDSKLKTDKESKRKMVIALDFATRRVIESTEGDAEIRRRLLQDSMDHLQKVQHVYKNIQEASQTRQKNNNSLNDDLVNLLIQMRHKKPAGIEGDLSNEDSAMPIIDYGTRVFDEDLLANMDHGLCLSMHQPYASLLMAGVKRHEGRTWPTTHRGRLWIAAAAKEPEEDEILVLESFYREYYKDTTLKFPKEYPVSCLLGSVYVEDCLEQEVYRKKYPSGESNSPFVLICSNPIILPIFYSIVGQHKIYPLDKELHKCAKLALQHAKYII